ncbi:glutamyl-tRNA reductase [Flavobacteriaceae bacterium]|nr:glutamyl-tRNA reductase [Flavobacteriaceae bacterium]MDC1543297.1 glutamyl-tRNA reductase [Flavobacteriaceae bacterium]
MTKAEHFHAIGVSYKTADIDQRGQFSLNDTRLHALFLDAKDSGVTDFLVINTCNRTELYSWTAKHETLVNLLCKHSGGDKKIFDKIGYTYSDRDAFHHLFRVGTGLESQILGDFEVIGQIKQSFYRSKKMQLAHGSLERLTNAVIQASKRIKTETEISSGATSVAFASVQYILKNVTDISQKNILLFGTGKIGANTCENLVKHTQNDHITLINRTQEKAEKIAGKFPVKVKPYGELTSAIHQSNVLIVATGAQKPTVSVDLIHNTKPLLILDLSIPRNVAPEVNKLPNIEVIHLDELSQITDATFEKRKKYIPQAEQILNEVEDDFHVWLEHRKYVPTLKAFKKKLTQIENFDEDWELETSPDRMAQKLTGQIAAYLRSNPKEADKTVALLNEVFQLSPENYS